MNLMLIALFMLITSLAAMNSSGVEDSKIEKPEIKTKIVQEEQKRLPFGFSVYGTAHNKMKSEYLNDNIAVDGYSYGLVLDYQILSYLTIYGLVGSTTLDGVSKDNKNNDFSDSGATLGLGGKFENQYKNLYYGIDLLFLYNKMDKIESFNRSAITPRIGYINDSKKLRVWGGVTYTYINQDFTLDIKKDHFLPTLGVEYIPISYLEFMGEVSFKEDYRAMTLRTTYRF
jgi:hypothetical protein